MQNNGPVKIQKETKGRGGKAVIAIYNLPYDKDKLKEIAGLLKKKFSVGGTVKDGIIEMQTDKLDEVKQLLKNNGLI
jgi:translation initiation factor 1